jgi:hypothetical protein
MTQALTIPTLASSAKAIEFGIGAWIRKLGVANEGVIITE